MKRVELAGAVMFAATLAGWLVAPRMVLASWLAAWWWAVGVVLGCFVNAWIHVLSGGAWGAPVRATSLLLGRRLPWLLPGVVVVALALRVLYPWATWSDEQWTRQFHNPAFVHAWLSPAFFTVRLVLYALAWWWLARPTSLASKGRAAFALAAYCIATTLAAVDLLMSLMPGWYSTAFGLVVMSTQALSGAAAVVIIALVPRTEWPSGGGVPVSRDLGNLMLMWCMTWGYVAFMQFLIIWSENLPHEISWYLPRLHTGWKWAALALVAVQLAVPFVALLFRSVKDQPLRLALVALLVLAATAFDAAWLVLPSVDATTWHGWWLQPLAMTGLALLVFGDCFTGDAARFGARVRHA
jgi:hypothetical protein